MQLAAALHRSRAIDPHAATSATLFAALFAGQAGLIAVTPVLPELAGDLDVSTALAGQLRTVTGLVAGVTALLLGVLAGRIGLGRQLFAGALLLAAGSLGSAVAPTFLLLAIAQAPIGMGVALVTTAGTLAAAEWVPAEHRTRALSWALTGQPAAWIVGMPLVGALGASSWRLAFVVLPLVAALVAAAAVARRAGEPPTAIEPVRIRAAFANRDLKLWAAAELLANSAWAGTLVYAGALFAESYGMSAVAIGPLLAVAAAAYVAGTFTFRRVVGREDRRRLVVLGLALAGGVALFGGVRAGVAASTILLSASAFVAGGRTLLSSSVGLSVDPSARAAVMAVRAATMQFGYFVGVFVAGSALAAAGYVALGLAVGVLLVGAAALFAPCALGRGVCYPSRLAATGGQA
ncbi:MAG TPA: MFS transporter [Gaiellaceae bacterium]|nr:MFS transporter [Gaiellaceae bacterium]